MPALVYQIDGQYALYYNGMGTNPRYGRANGLVLADEIDAIEYCSGVGDNSNA